MPCSLFCSVGQLHISNEGFVKQFNNPGAISLCPIGNNLPPKNQFCQTTSLILMSMLWMCVSQVLMELLFCCCGPCLYQCVQCQEANHNHFFLQVSDLCCGLETVPWICSCFVRLCRAEGGTDFGKTPNKPKGVIIFGGV